MRPPSPISVGPCPPLAPGRAGAHGGRIAPGRSRSSGRATGTGAAKGPVPAALRTCPVQQAQFPGPVRSGSLPACAGAIPHSPGHLRLRAARKQRTRSSAMGVARCRHRYPALSTVLSGRCPRCWSRRRPGRGGPGREAVLGAAPGPPRAPAPSPSTPPGPPSPPPRRGPETQRRGLRSPSPPLHRCPCTVSAGRRRPGQGSEREGGAAGELAAGTRERSPRGSAVHQ